MSLFFAVRNRSYHHKPLVVMPRVSLFPFRHMLVNLVFTGPQIVDGVSNIMDRLFEWPVDVLLTSNTLTQ